MTKCRAYLAKFSRSDAGQTDRQTRRPKCKALTLEVCMPNNTVLLSFTLVAGFFVLADGCDNNDDFSFDVDVEMQDVL